ncbi:MAG: 50S ribosomal protein L29 [Treponema sp.]|nr:50S ribosomal protein L29 [Treponema sp.]
MKNNEIRKLSTEEITKKIEEYKEELFNLRLSQSTGSLEKPSRIRELRKLVARMKTVLRERELNKEV